MLLQLPQAGGHAGRSGNATVPAAAWHGWWIVQQHEAAAPVPSACLQGNPYAVTSILDTIRAIKAPVSTVGFGMVGGTAAAVLAGGTKVWGAGRL